MKVLTVRVPDEVVGTIDQMKKEKNETRSEVFRKIFGLNKFEKLIDIGIKELPLLNWVQMLVVNNYAFMEFLKEKKELFTSLKKQNKSDFYNYIYNTMKYHKEYMEGILLTKLEGGFSLLDEDSLIESADFVEDIALLIDNSTKEDKKVIRNLANKYRSFMEKK